MQKPARKMWLGRILAVTVLSTLCLSQPVSVPRGKPFPHDIRPGRGVRAVHRLSQYNPALSGTPGDTRVYVLEGREKGGTAVVAAGTHGNEIAGIMAAILLVEHSSVKKGRLLVIPHANNSAITYPDPRRPGPTSIRLKTAGGERRFAYGARLTRPDHQGQPDPEKFRHPSSTTTLDGFEARNLDRAYPGVRDGNLTQRIAFGILELLRREEADVAFDLHEAGPESRLAWMVVANPKNVETAANAILNLDMAGIPMQLEPSAETFRGLSHREWGDATRAQSFLFETPNPAMVSRASAADPVHDPKLPLNRRVGVHLSTLKAILDAFNEPSAPESRILLENVPGWPEISKSDLGSFYK